MKNIKEFLKNPFIKYSLTLIEMQKREFRSLFCISANLIEYEVKI